jgi:DsbC/DsbD-like thiol-disulfide interchange protein
MRLGMKNLSLACLSACVVVSFAVPALAGPPEDVISIEVLPGWRTAEGTHMAGLRFTLAPGWKTYWRAPGDAGIPPAFAWTGSANIGGAEFHWPVPEVFHLNGMMSIGYSGQVVIPIELTPDDPSGAVHLAGSVDLGVCHEICVPMTLDFDAMLPAGGARDAAITAALVDRPLTADEAGVVAARCSAVPSEAGLALTAALQMPPDGGDEIVVIETGQAGVWVSEAATRWQDGWLVADVEMISADGGAVGVDRSDLRITVLGASGVVDIHGCEAG